MQDETVKSEEGQKEEIIPSDDETLSMEDLTELFMPSPTREEGRAQVDKSKISRAYRYMSHQTGIPEICFDYRAVSEPNAVTRASSESIGQRFYLTTNHGDITDWIFIARVGVPKESLDSIAASLAKKLLGACTVGILFATELDWRVYKIFYSTGEVSKAKKFAAIFQVGEEVLAPLDCSFIPLTHASTTQTALPLDAFIFKDFAEKFCEHIAAANLHINESVSRRLMASLFAKKFLLLTGLAGSGKTKLAHAFVKWITPNIARQDPFWPGAKIESDRKTYTVRRSDSLSVEFSNDDNEEKETLVSLPRTLIDEWATYITVNQLARSTSARQIREGVSGQTKYSLQQNSFENHLKAAAFALIDALNIDDKNPFYRLVAVGADWTTNENVLGYQDALQPNIYRKPTSGCLDIILRAHKEMEIAGQGGDPARPYFLILDEMNLSHVERYFADILSAIESGEEIALHSSDEPLCSFEGDLLPVPAKIKLPENLFIIGTVNIDETTYMFSPKVLDRANVIEFRASVEDIGAFLNNPVKVDMESLVGKGAAFGPAFVAETLTDAELDEETASLLKNSLREVFGELAEIGAEFGYRTAFEIARFVYFYKKLSSEGWKFEEALDAQVLQKLMPKLHGSERKLGPVLEALDAFCDKHLCPLSRTKIKRMQDRLRDGFTSFAEA